MSERKPQRELLNPRICERPAVQAEANIVGTVVQAKHETVVITKHGKSVAKLVPVEPQGDDIFGFLRGKVTITGDVVSPALPRREWAISSDYARHPCCALAVGKALLPNAEWA